MDWWKKNNDDSENIFKPTEKDWEGAKARLKSNIGKSGRQTDAEVTFDLNIIQQYEQGKEKNK